MTRDDWIGIAIFLAIIAIAAMGGSRNAALVQQTTQSPENKEASIQSQLTQAQSQAGDLQKQVQAAEDAKTHSPYYGKVSLAYAVHNDDPKLEYIFIQTDYSATTTMDITGWTIRSDQGTQVSIPQASLLYFGDGPNSEQDIVLSPGDHLYLTTGLSPNGASFKVNKCSGYLSQFQTFTPYLFTNCPIPSKEDLSSIPHRTINDACLDYIDTFPICHVQTESLPANWTSECTDFIYNKLNYSACTAAHKNDADFYTHEWRVFLKRSDSIWKQRRETLTLYDTQGKIVSTISY